MSRLGKLPIIIPAGVQVEIKPEMVHVKGPKGEVAQPLHPHVTVTQDGNTLHVTVRQPEVGSDKALWGLARQLVNNAVIGTSQGFVKKLEMSGIGFKAQMEGKDLVLNIGFSHPVKYIVSAGVIVAVEKNNVISVSGASRQQVGQVAAEIRSLKKPEPYKGKGIKYAGEIIRRKAGKVVKAAGAK
jgi:large subunit ribosomal protein L6